MIADALIYSLLQDICGIERVYPIKFPHSVVMPAATYEVVSENSLVTLSGDSGVYRASIDVTVYAKNTEALAPECNKIFENIPGFNSNVGNHSVFNVNIDGVSSSFDQDVSAYTKRITISILYRR